MFYNENWDALRDLVPFVQFKKCENFSWRSVSTFSEIAGWSLHTKSNYSSMDVFHVFLIVQMVPNHHILFPCRMIDSKFLTFQWIKVRSNLKNLSSGPSVVHSFLIHSILKKRALFNDCALMELSISNKKISFLSLTPCK